MAQSKQNKVPKELTEAVTIRVPVSLNQQLREKLSKDPSRSRADLALAAFSDYLSSDVSSPVLNPSGIPSQSVLDSGKVSVIVSEAELPWVKRLLEILRSGRQVVAKAILYNLNAFGLFVGVAEDEHLAHDASELTDLLGPEVADAIGKAEAVQGDVRELVAEHGADRGNHKSNRKRAR